MRVGERRRYTRGQTGSLGLLTWAQGERLLTRAERALLGVGPVGGSWEAGYGGGAGCDGDYGGRRSG